jgi:hypothetical protein
MGQRKLLGFEKIDTNEKKDKADHEQDKLEDSEVHDNVVEGC